MLQYQGGKNLTLRHYGLGAELDRWLERERPRRIFDVTMDLVYADIPYAGTLDYKGLPPFDHAAFWTWAAQVAATGARMLVSEFTAPDPWRHT